MFFSFDEFDSIYPFVDSDIHVVAICHLPFGQVSFDFHTPVLMGPSMLVERCMEIANLWFEGGFHADYGVAKEQWSFVLPTVKGDKGTFLGVLQKGTLVTDPSSVRD